MLIHKRKPFRETRFAPLPSGFTLIELMVVVAIIAILAAIAYPSYQDSIRKGYRGQAKADLLDIAQRAERHRTVNQGSYAGFATKLSSADLQSPRQGTARYAITFTFDDASPQAYVLKAAPSGAQTRDARCRTLTLNQRGQKGIEGTPTPTGSVAECW